MESARVSMKSCDVCIHTSAQCGCSMKPDLLGPAAIAPTKPMSVFGLVTGAGGANVAHVCTLDSLTGNQ